MRIFDTVHPLVLVAYVLVALVLTMAAFQPVVVGLALVSALALRVCLQGWRVVARALRWQVLLVVLIAVVNPLFASVGSTELFRIGTHAVYLESFAYGLCMGALLVAVMTQLMCASCVLTSDKIMAVLGNRLPTISLMMSMVLRLVPRFTRRGREIALVQDACTASCGAPQQRMRQEAQQGAYAQQAMERGFQRAAERGSVGYRGAERQLAGRSAAEQSLAGRSAAEQSLAGQPGSEQCAEQPSAPQARRALSRRVAAREHVSRLARLTSVLMGWSMEDSLETADAMRARGWSSETRRTSYRRWRFGRADALALAVVLGLGVLCAALAWAAVSSYRFYPTMSALSLWWGYIPLAAFYALPLFVVLGDHLRWTR